MVMEFISGGSLRNLLGGLRKRLCIEPDKAIKIALGILAGISAMHNKHIVHRDIKPENILMEGDTPKIADLGISRLLLENQLAETLAGTNFYISPELVLERKASFGTDIWSFGVTFYEMLFGCFPYNMENITYKELTTNRNLKLLFSDHVNLAENIKNILIKCLKVNPEERYKNADEIIKDMNLYSKTEEEAPEDQLLQIQELLHDPAGFAAGEEKLKNLLKKYPKSAKACLILGEFYNKTGNYHNAIDVFIKGLGYNPANSKIYWAIAMSYQKAGNNQDAISSLQKALDLGLDKSLERYGKILLQNLKQKKST
jgi:serine/threonine protein kinase